MTHEAAPPRSEPDTPIRYFPALDAVRFVSCALVVVSHCFSDATVTGEVTRVLYNFVHSIGKVSVDVFFSLSGFLITKLLLEELAARGRVDLLAFYIRRTLRIWPVYYVALLLAALGAAFFGDGYMRPLGAELTPEFFTTVLPWYATFQGNWLENFPGRPTSISTLWSVCVEEQFYILFPITFIFSKRRHPVFVPALVGIACSCAFRILMALTDGPIMHNTFARADNLLAGALLAQLLHARPVQLTTFFQRFGLSAEVVTIGLVLLFTQWNNDEIATWVGWLPFYLVSAAITTTLVGVFALGGGPIGRHFSGAKSRFLGRLTYAAYSFHVYSVALAWVLLSPIPIGPWWLGVLRAAIAVPLSCLIAYVCLITFEQRILRFKDQFRPRR